MTEDATTPRPAAFEILGVGVPSFPSATQLAMPPFRAIDSGAALLRYLSQRPEYVQAVWLANSLPDLAPDSVLRFLQGRPGLGHIRFALQVAQGSTTSAAQQAAQLAGISLELTPLGWAEWARQAGLGRQPNDRPPVWLDLPFSLVGRELRQPAGLFVLTPSEAAILRCLLAHPGRPCSRQDLLQIARHHSQGPSTDRVVDTHIKMLRHKLHPYGHCIRTIRGVGYEFVWDGRA